MHHHLLVCYSKLGFGSVSELLLYRLDSLDLSVRNALHLAAVLGTEFELVDAALAYDEMYNVMDGERSRAALALQEALHVAVEEGIIEESFTSSGYDDEEEFDDTINEAQASLCASLGNITLSLKGYRRSHPAYSENRRYRFTHDSWKTSILDGESVNLVIGAPLAFAHITISMLYHVCSHAG
jgi:predicted ATPase